MQKSLAHSCRIALGVTLLGALALGGLGCGSSSHSNPDAKDASKDTTGAAGTSDATGAAGTDGGAGMVATAGTDGGAGTTGAAGADAGAGTTGTAGADAGAGTTGTAGADAGAGTTGAAGNDGGAGSDAGAGMDGGTSDASDGGDVACTNACTLAATRCGAGGGIQTCIAAASGCTAWGTEATCGSHSTCSAASGTPTCGCNATSCTAVGKFCSSTTGRTDCALDAEGCFFATGTEVACGQRQSCTGVAGSATCSCNVDPSCNTGTDTLCAGAGSISHCALDADNCPFVASTTVCPSHQSCTGNKPTAACTCDPTPVDCMGASGTTFCATSTSVSTCRTDSNTCIFVDTAVGCGTHQACTTPTAGASVCSCVTDTTCGTTVGNVCVNGNASSVSCAKDSDQCVFNAGTTACGAHQTCGGASSTCACNPTVCTTNGPFCDGGNVSTCATDANSCLFLSAANSTTCTTNSTCTGGAGSASCVCNPAPTGCTGTGSFCKSASLQGSCTTDGTCPADGNVDSPCGPHQTCKGSGLGGACSCDNTCTAAQAGTGVGTYCVDPLHQQTCTNDLNSCHTASNLVACVGVQTCQGLDGSGACQCPAQGSTAGTGCTTLGATVCQGNIVLTCINDGASGCHYWAQPNDCAQTGLVCGTKTNGGTTAACQCPEHTGGDYYADPSPSANTPALFPTGINSPVSCRFGTLTEALSLATSGDRVIATSAAPPVDFAAETFPLVVPGGVTLTTADGVLNAPNASDYVIAFNSGGAGAAVALGNSSVVEGFTVLNANGTASGSAISILGTNATVDTVTLDGTNGGTLANGVSVTGAGQGTVHLATTTGFTTGLNVSTTSGPAVVLANSNLNGNATGIGISNGTVSAQTASVNGGSGNGVVIKASTGLASTLLGTGLSVSNMTAAGISQSATGGSVTLTLTSADIGHNGAGGISLSSGSGTLGAVNVHDNTGSGITQSGGTTTLGSGGTTTVQANTAKGVLLSVGTMTVGAATISGNGSDGVAASGSATLISNTGAQYVNNVGNGINANTATLTFNGTAAAPISASNNSGDGILVTGGAITANYLTLSANGTGATKKSGLELAGTVAVNLGVATDAALSFTGNGADGVNIAGTTAGSAIDMRRAQIKSNGADGIAVDVNGGTASIVSTTVSNNTGNGINISRALPVSSVVKVSFDTMTVSSNGGIGVWLQGNSGNVAASLTNSTVSLNTGVGVKVQQGAATTTQETLQGDNINQNGGGGVVFSTSSTLSSFQGNIVHGNTGDQIVVSARQNATVSPVNANPTWIFRSVGNACDTNQNSIFGYGSCSGGGVGIRVNSVLATSVDAENVTWAHSAPSAGTDYVATGTNGVTATSPCAANAACP